MFLCSLIIQPPENAILKKSPQGSTKVKCATIDMFFKSPPKQPAKPSNILGYFKPVADTKTSKSDGDVGKLKKKDEGKADVVKKYGAGNLSKKENDKKNKNDVSTGDGLVNGSEKKTTKTASKSKPKEKSSNSNKLEPKEKSSKINKGKRTEKKSITHTEGKKSLVKSQHEGGDELGDADGSLEDFDTSKPEKNRKEKSQKPSKSSERTVNKNLKGSSSKVSEEDCVESSNKETDVISDKCSNVVSYQDFLDGKEDDEENVTEMVDSKTDDANSSVVISYEDFLSQSSAEDEEEEVDRNKPVKNDNENNHLSEDLVDVDMEDASAMEESAISMETDTTSDDDIFQDDDESEMATTNSSSDNVLTLSVNFTPESATSNQKSKEDIPTKAVKPSSLDVQEKIEKSSSDKPTTAVEDDEDLCLPKRKEVKVTAQVHTPPVITPATSPSASPSNSPATCKLKSNVVVDVTDLDLEVIHVEETDVDNKPSSSSNVFNFSGTSTPKREQSSDVTIKPAPTKVFSIFQKKSAVKDSSQSESKDANAQEDCSKTSTKEEMKSEDSKTKVSKTVKEKKSTKTKSVEGIEDTDEDDLAKDKTVGKKRKLSLNKNNKKESKASLDSKNKTPKAVKEENDGKGDLPEDKAEGKKRKLSLTKNKQQEPKASPAPSRRRSSGRAAALKARKDILEQELQREAAGSESATSQEDVLPPQKRTLKDLFPSATDTDASEKEDEKKRGKQENIPSGKGEPTTPGHGRKKLTKQKAVTTDTKSDKTKTLKSPKASNNNKSKRKSQVAADTETPADEVPKKKRGRPRKDETVNGKIAMFRSGPVMTSSPKVDKTKVRLSTFFNLFQCLNFRGSISSLVVSEIQLSFQL